MAEELSPCWIFKHNIPATPKLECKKVLEELTSGQDDIKELYNARNELAVNLASGTSAKCIEMCEAYLPYAKYAISELMSASEKGVAKLKLSWAPAFTDAYIPDGFVVSNIQQESTIVLFAEGCSYRREAWELFAEMGSAIDDDKIKIINNRLCVAAGIFDALSRKPLSSMNSKDVILYEFNTDFCTAMNELCLFEAEALIIRKAKGKTSNKTIQKIAADVCSRSHHAADLLRSSAKKMKSSDRFNLLLRYCELSSILYQCIFSELSAQLALEEDKAGLALGYLRIAIPTNAQKKMMGESLVKKHFGNFLALVQAEVKKTEDLLEKTTTKNNTVFFDAVVEPEKLPAVDQANISKLVPYVEREPLQFTIAKGDKCSYM